MEINSKTLTKTHSVKAYVNYMWISLGIELKRNYGQNQEKKSQPWTNLSSRIMLAYVKLKKKKIKIIEQDYSGELETKIKVIITDTTK
uniref:Uncharacterized protein n=1 Tax=Pyxicephalus adspersus TaxID=30357 RepID=A0AAV3AI54_PYXAD|nr:TPA: hypothetical protein GDO54_007015 [Pyxicephalus adspersus]